MKRPLTLATLAALLAGPQSPAEVEREIPLGIEAVTGYRNEYVHRGFKLASNLLDFQVEAEVTVADDTYLNLGGWFASEFNDDFAELSGFLDLRHDLTDQFTIGGSVTYHDFDDTFFNDGFDAGAFLVYYFGEDWDLTVGAYRDFGADAWHSKADVGWSLRLGDKAYLTTNAGVSWVDDYYGVSGFHDFFGRVSLTYNVSNSVSITPFGGWSLEIEDGDGSELFGGLWFEVSF